MSQPRKSFKTAKGLELPLMNLRGKEYLQVMHRLQWFREDHPNGVIETELVRLDPDKGTAIFKAKIFASDVTNNRLLPLATAFGSESVKDFGDYVEKAETKAIGRALSMAGYGTQFSSVELDEGARIVDSPAPVVEASVSSEASIPRSSPFKKKNAEQANGAAKSGSNSLGWD